MPGIVSQSVKPAFLTHILPDYDPETACAIVESVVRVAPQVLFAIDREGRISFSGGRGLANLKIEPERLVGRSLFDLCRNWPWVIASARRALSGESVSATGDIAGHVYEAYWETLRDAAGEISGAVSVSTDVTERCRAETALKERELAFRNLFANNPMPMWVFDRATLRFLEVNAAALRQYGYTREEMLQMRLVDLRLESDVPSTIRALRMRKPGANRVGVVQHRRKNGYLIDVEINSHSIDFDGHDAVLSLLNDVTARRRMETEREQIMRQEKTAHASAERARQSLSLISEASAILGSSLNYQETLPAVARLAVSQLSDWCMIDVLEPPEVVKRVAVVHRDPLKAEAALDLERSDSADDWLSRMRGVIRTRQPEIGAGQATNPLLRSLGFQAFIIVPLVARGSCLGVMALVRGQADRPYGVNELALAEELAGRCALAIDNCRLFRQAQNAVEARDDLFSIASHDLKTPLTSIQAISELLMHSSRAEPGAPDSPGALARKINEQSARIVELVDRLLDFSRIRAGKIDLQLEPLNLSELAREVLERFRHQLEERNIRADLQAEKAVSGRWDRLRMDQVLSNLIANAIKYGGCTPIVVAVSETDGKAQLVVRDFGPGIDPYDRMRIFDRFERGPRTDDTGGLGLGLFIVRQIVESHGGTVHCENPDGRGAAFIVRLPRISPPAG